jgi:putative addiction module component (TIGR02574 family)
LEIAMPPSLPQIEAQALQLGPQERAQLAELLWQSLDAATEEDVSQAWQNELDRRLQSLDAGTSETVTSHAVMGKLRQRLHGG